MNGQGIYYFPNGDVYQGGFKDGDRNGYGIYHYASKDRY